MHNKSVLYFYERMSKLREDDFNYTVFSIRKIDLKPIIILIKQEVAAEFKGVWRYKNI